MFVSKLSPKISVVLPFYNSARTLNRALNSLQNQTFQNFECLLIDNNSADGSIQIAKGYQNKDKRFKVHSEKKQGVVFASNTGLALSEGEYICRMDADDWMFPDRLKLQCEFLDINKDYDVVSGLVKYVRHRQATGGFERYVNWVNSVQTYDNIMLKRFIESPIINPTVMWRKTVSDTYDMYRDGAFPEDYELWLRWLDAGVKITKVEHPLIKWYDSDSRLTRTDSRYNETAFYEVKTKYLAKWLSRNNPHHPKVAIWGASRISRRRAKALEKYKIEIINYIDISVKRKLDKSILLYSDIPAPENVFILVYIAHFEARAKTMDFLNNRGFSEGQNYLLVS